MVKSFDEVSINYITQPHSYFTVMAVTPVTADTYVMANVKP
jgi:hypothetical protein